MKKAILALLILSMLLALAACGSSGPAGTWHIQSVRNDSGSVTVEEAPELRDLMGDLVLNKDGSGTMIIMGEIYRITWDDSSITGDDGTRLSYSMKGDRLELDAFGVIYSYTR